MVLVSHEHQLIHLKTRKTAGTSLEMMLEVATGLTKQPVSEKRNASVTEQGIVGYRVCPPEDRVEGDEAWPPHLSAGALRDAIGETPWGRYHKIVCVRNPFERVISMFHWRNSNRPPEKQNETFEGFADFVRTRWPNDRDLVMLDKKFVPDILIRFEHLQDDLGKLAQTCGLNFEGIELPVSKKRSNRRLGATSEYYTDELADIVRKRMRWAFRFAGYKRKVPE